MSASSWYSIFYIVPGRADTSFFICMIIITIIIVMIMIITIIVVIIVTVSTAANGCYGMLAPAT